MKAQRQERVRSSSGLQRCSVWCVLACARGVCAWVRVSVCAHGKYVRVCVCTCVCVHVVCRNTRTSSAPTLS